MTINQNPNFGTHNTSVRPGKIEYIVIHYVGATGDARANVNYYNQRTTTNASADFFVGFAGDIWQYNPDPVGRYCWAVGGKKLNENGILYGIAKNANCVNIEMCVRNNGSKADTSLDWYFEDATVASAIELTKYLMKLYGIDADHVIRHRDVTGKICGNPYVYNHTKHTWDGFKSALVVQSEVTKNSGWVQESAGWKFYNGDTGVAVTNDWVQDNGKWYWFNGAGVMVTNTWYQYNEKWYYLGADGAMCQSQLVENSGKIYAVDKNGEMITGSITLVTDLSGALHM